MVWTKPAPEFWKQSVVRDFSLTGFNEIAARRERRQDRSAYAQYFIRSLSILSPLLPDRPEVLPGDLFPLETFSRYQESRQTMAVRFSVLHLK